MTLLLALLIGWIAVSIPVTLAIGRASAVAAEREVERRAMRPLVQLRPADAVSIRRAA